MTFAAIYALLVGILMIGQWAFFLATRQVPELETEPYTIRFHLAAEFITAVSLIAGGLGLLFRLGWGVELTLAALGMLLYAVINSPGYFAQRRQWPLVAMFGVLALLDLVSLALLFQHV